MVAQTLPCGEPADLYSCSVPVEASCLRRVPTASCGSTTWQETPLQHVQQCYNWDCGLACVLMVLKTLRVSLPSLAELHKLCGTTSVWTIDLAHLLSSFGIPAAFTTCTLGANPAYAYEGFYMEQLPHDELRVQSLFQAAAGAGVSVRQASLLSQDLSSFLLRGRNVIIVLVNKTVLAEAAGDQLLPLGLRPGWARYTGHFIILTGYNAASNTFLAHDPCLPSGPTPISASLLDKARQSFGTDEDLLLLDLDAVPAAQARSHGQPMPCKALPVYVDGPGEIMA